MRTIRRLSSFAVAALCSSFLSFHQALGGKIPIGVLGGTVKEKFLPDTPRSVSDHSTRVSSHSWRAIQDLAPSEIDRFYSAKDGEGSSINHGGTIFPPSDRLTPTRKAYKNRHKKVRYKKFKKDRDKRKKKPVAWKT